MGPRSQVSIPVAIFCRQSQASGPSANHLLQAASRTSAGWCGRVGWGVDMMT